MEQDALWSICVLNQGMGHTKHYKKSLSALAKEVITDDVKNGRRLRVLYGPVYFRYNNRRNPIDFSLVPGPDIGQFLYEARNCFS